MRITLRKSKRAVTVTFRADSSEDGRNLKTALLAATDGAKVVPDSLPTRIIDELGKLGYGADHITPKKRARS